MKQTVILKCNCRSQYQDKKYGAGLRVMNRRAKDLSHEARCTVCGDTRPVPEK